MKFFLTLCFILASVNGALAQDYTFETHTFSAIVGNVRLQGDLIKQGYEMRIWFP